MEFATAVPVRVKESLELTVILLMTGAAGRGATGAVAAGTVTSSALETALVPAAVVSVAVNAYTPADKAAVVKLQTKALFAVVVPAGSRRRPTPSPWCRVARSRQGHGIVGIDRAIGDNWSRRERRGRSGCGRHCHIERAGTALVPAAVLSVAVNAYRASRQVRRREAPGASAARGRGSSGFAPPSDTVTVAPFGAVPVRVTESFELTAPALITGAAGAALTGSLTTCVPSAFDLALVPPGVVSVA